MRIENSIHHTKIKQHLAKTGVNYFLVILFSLGQWQWHYFFSILVSFKYYQWYILVFSNKQSPENDNIRQYFERSVWNHELRNITLTLSRTETFVGFRFGAASSPAHLFAIRERQKRLFFKNCSMDEVGFREWEDNIFNLLNFFRNSCTYFSCWEEYRLLKPKFEVLDIYS